MSKEGSAHAPNCYDCRHHLVCAVSPLNLSHLSGFPFRSDSHIRAFLDALARAGAEACKYFEKGEIKITT